MRLADSALSLLRFNKAMLKYESNSQADPPSRVAGRCLKYGSVADSPRSAGGALSSRYESCAVPAALDNLAPFYPALPRWANEFRGFAAVWVKPNDLRFIGGLP
jgi:hypothetical protein